MSGQHFESFWDAWPANGSKGYEDYTRKKDKKKCAEKWANGKLDSFSAVILRDVEQRKKFDKGWRESRGKFLSAPMVYLNNERWNDGDFADIRDEQRSKITKQHYQPVFDSGPEMSSWAKRANLVMLYVLMSKRGVGEDRLRRMIEAKKEIVKEFEVMAADKCDINMKSYISAVESALRPI